MNLEQIRVQNYRGLDLEVSKFGLKNQIIGKNDAGKSTLLNAIQKVLDPTYRNKNFVITDSTDKNCEDIILEATLVFDPEKEYSKEFLTVVLENAQIIDSDPTEYAIDDIRNQKITIKVSGIYNEEHEQYDTTVMYNNQKRSGRLPIDDFITLIYLSPVYSYEESLKKYFQTKKRIDKANKVGIDKEITDAIQELNVVIQNSNSFKELQGELNKNVYDQKKIRKIESNVPVDDIYSGLVVNEYSEGTQVAYFGDGNRRIFSNDLEIMRAKMKEKEITILLIEEPENHLFIDKQKDYIEKISMNKGQIIVTTHSPYIVNFAKEYSIIKLNESNINYEFINCVENDFGYFYNEKVSELFYYDNLLLVEGYSEELFYDYITQIPEVKKIIIDHNLGIFNIKGIGFEKYINTFSKLGINIFIKTDNDFVKKKNQKYHFAGIKRGIKYLEGKSNFIAEYSTNFPNNEILNVSNNEILNVSNEEINTNEFDINEISSNMQEEINWIVEYLEHEKIYVSTHIEGFEGDLKALVPSVDKEILNQAKHENLYTYLKENKNELFDAVQDTLESNKYENTLMKVFLDLKEIE